LVHTETDANIIVENPRPLCLTIPETAPFVFIYPAHARYRTAVNGNQPVCLFADLLVFNQEVF
jgi:hypothetical protein